MARRLYLSLLGRLPPRGAWLVWRAAHGAARLARRRADPTEVAVARVALGASEIELRDMLAELVLRAGDPGQVLVISDCDAVDVVAATGCRYEYVPAREDWERHLPGADHERFVSGRVKSILASYRAVRVER